MSVIDSFRRPEHTGENRCLPCIAVNIAFVIVVGLAVSVFPPVVGLVVLVGGILSVYLRGYVVPGTSSFASQLVGVVGLAGVFGRDNDAPDYHSELLDVNTGPDVMFPTLLDAGVPVEEEDGLFPAVDTHEEWESTMATLRKATDKELAEAVADTVPFEAAVDAESGSISLDGPSVFMWVSRPQIIAGVAMLYAVVEYSVDPMVVLAAMESVRMFVEVCPDCGGPVEGTMTCNRYSDTAGLYGLPEHEVLDCTDCGMVVYESPDE